MKCWFIFFVVFSTIRAKETTKRTTILADPPPDPCHAENENDIATTDPLVNHMFEAYKRQAESESPPAEHATTLTEVNAHEMLARLFLFLDKHLREVPEMPDDAPHDSSLEYLFQTDRSNEDRWAAERKWPYRCFKVETAEALDKFMSSAMHSIYQQAVRNDLELGMLGFAFYMRLPQFATYVQSLETTPIHQLCSMVHSHDNLDDALHWTGVVLQALSPIADTACQAPYESQLFCKIPALIKDIESMAEDSERVGSSEEMKLFAYFWFLAPGLSNICDDAFNLELSGKVFNPLAQSAVARLDEIAQLASKTGDDLEKIRTFIYDYNFNHFSRYAATGMDWISQPKEPFTYEESPESKYNTFGFSSEYSKPEKDFLRCFRTFFATLNDMEKALVAHADMSEIHALARTALFWFLHPNFQLEGIGPYNSFLDGLSYNMEHTDSLVRLGKAMKQYQNTICTSNNPDTFCSLYDILRDIQIYADILQETPTIKILNPTSDYKKVLELSTMRSMQTDIAALQVGQDQLEQSLFDMRSSLGDHFYQLATFDQDKAEYDVGFLQDKITDFNQRISNSKIKDELQKLLYYAIGSNTAEMAQLTTQLAAALAENFNPLKWLSGGGGLQDVLDQANALAKAEVDTAKLIALHETMFPRIMEKARAIARALEANSVVHDKLNVTFHQLKDKESIDIDAVQANFLIDYRGYDPGWSNGDIAEYTVLLNGVIDELCEILYSGGTAASAVVQMVGASKSVCLNIKTTAEVLEAVYQEMYEFQYEFMEAMAVAVRALVTKHSANSVRTLPEKADDVEKYRLHLKFYTFRIKLQSKQHILLALREVCDVDEYKNGGVQTAECKKALASQVFSDIDRVIGHTVNECPSDQTSEFYVRFPARSNPDKHILDPGVLDLTRLYAGELTPFKIPHSSTPTWVQKFVSYSVPAHDDVALYVKRFEIFLPDLTDNVRHDITVRIKQDGLMNVAPGGSVKYGFSTPKVFNLVYGENKITCVNGFEPSPYPTLCPPEPSKVCIASQGVVSENEIAPPLHSNWLIKFVLPRDLPAPNPTYQAPFYMSGVLSICHQNPKNIDLSNQPRPGIATSSGVSEDRCCPDKKFWYISEFFATFQGCQYCPSGSSPKLGGLYCSDSTRHNIGVRYKKGFKHQHHHHHHHHKAKSFFAVKKHKMLSKKVVTEQTKKLK